jgi:hypothetical protein
MSKELTHYVRELMIARTLKDQELINEAAQALADYLWKPEYDISYDSLLEGLGFVKGGKIYGIFK